MLRDLKQVRVAEAGGAGRRRPVRDALTCYSASRRHRINCSVPRQPTCPRNLLLRRHRQSLLASIAASPPLPNCTPQPHQHRTCTAQMHG